ncbi:MAG TPA: prolyl oligopeptidase family serine peptidase [Kofleriaceae bacterium]
MRWLLVAVLLFTVTSANAAPKSALRESKPLAWPSYAQLGPIAKAYVREPEYATMAKDPGVELSRIVYAVGSVDAVAIACRPRDASPKATKPLLLYLHGGAGERAKIGADNFQSVLEIRRFCMAGFVVIAPQYRGVDGGGGTDEVGGRDVDDVAALIPLARGFGYVDVRRTFAWGFSRGAMMALQLVRDGVPLTAVVAVGTGADFGEGLRKLPEFAKDVPDDAKTTAGIERRSPIRWVGKLAAVPILFLHGAEDPASPAADLATLVGKLLEANALCELHLYAREDHPISGHLDEVHDRSIDWFQHVRKRSIATEFDKTLRASTATAAAARVRSLRKTEPDRWEFGERELNRLGYGYLFQGQHANAVAAFELNVELYPKSANAWDSLGEGYETAGRKADAARAYAKAFALDPSNTRAQQKATELKR